MYLRASKDASARTRADGIRRVAAGERVIDPDLVAAALETGARPLATKGAASCHRELNASASIRTIAQPGHFQRYRPMPEKGHRDHDREPSAPQVQTR